MVLYDMDGTGEVEFLCNAYTTVIYEQEFKRSLIADVFGKIDLRTAATNFDENGNQVVLDYTLDNWESDLRAAWAMRKTACIKAAREHRETKNIGSFHDWVLSLSDEVNFTELSNVVVGECQRGLFRTRTAATEQDKQA